MVARGMAAIASNESRNWPPTVRASSGPPNSLMSAPAAKMRSPPQTTTAPGGSDVSDSAAAASCRSNSVERAFILGRSSRMTATPSSRLSTVTNSLTAGEASEQKGRRLGPALPVEPQRHQLAVEPPVSAAMRLRAQRIIPPDGADDLIGGRVRVDRPANHLLQDAVEVGPAEHPPRLLLQQPDHDLAQLGRGPPAASLVQLARRLQMLPVPPTRSPPL